MGENGTGSERTTSLTRIAGCEGTRAEAQMVFRARGVGAASANPARAGTRCQRDFTTTLCVAVGEIGAPKKYHLGQTVEIVKRVHCSTPGTDSGFLANHPAYIA
jgi:hypothetical protein